MPDDPYRTLGVSRSASADEIKKAYRRLSKENHPDANPDDAAAAERFKSVQAAYEIVGDAEKRKQFDQYGPMYEQYSRAQKAGASRGPGGGNPFAGGGVDLEDLFGGGVDLGDLFGGFGGGGRKRSRQPRAHKGADAKLDVTVPFTVAARGGGHDVTLDRGGRTETVSVKIPAGVDDGATIRLAGQGAPGVAGGAAGDLLLTVRVAPHPVFRREGHNLVCDLPLSPAEAALGAKVDVPTLSDGDVVLTIPAGTSSGQRLRLRGKGVPDRKSGGHGDQFVVVKIVVPKDLGDEERELYERLAAVSTHRPRD